MHAITIQCISITLMEKDYHFQTQKSIFNFHKLSFLSNRSRDSEVDYSTQLECKKCES